LRAIFEVFLKRRSRHRRKPRLLAVLTAINGLSSVQEGFAQTDMRVQTFIVLLLFDFANCFVQVLVETLPLWESDIFVWSKSIWRSHFFYNAWLSQFFDDVSVFGVWFHVHESLTVWGFKSFNASFTDSVLLLEKFVYFFVFILHVIEIRTYFSVWFCVCMGLKAFLTSICF